MLYFKHLSKAPDDKLIRVQMEVGLCVWHQQKVLERTGEEKRGEEKKSP